MVDSHRQQTTGKKPDRESGFTLLELIITLTIISILAAGTVPVARNLIRREKELELRRNLRELRQAIDKYKDACEGRGGQPAFSPLYMIDRPRDKYDCYPKDLYEDLVKGVPLANRVDGGVIRFLRRIPKDPFTGSDQWGERSMDDDPRSTGGRGGDNVFDVFTTYHGLALDGKTYYDTDW